MRARKEATLSKEAGLFIALFLTAKVVQNQEMPSRHSKNGGDRPYYTFHEKKSAGVSGSSSQRLGSDSQLPFGHCPLTLNKIVEPVVSPSGRIYEREAILEYLLKKTKELKALQREYEAQQVETVLDRKSKSFKHLCQ